MKNLTSKLSAGTIFRTIALIFSVLANFIAYDSDMGIVFKVAAGLVLVVVVGVVYWYNQDLTEAAKLGTEVTNALKDGQITIDEVQDILAKAEKAVEDKDTTDGDGND